MISGSMIFIGIAILIWVCYSKIKNVVSQGEKHSTLRALLELGMSFLAFLFLLFSQYARVVASTEQPFYLGDVFESSQYLSLGTWLIPVIMFLTFFEIIQGLKIFAVRGRMVSEEEK